MLDANLEEMLTRVSPGDIVLLYDPQTAGLAEGLRSNGLHVAWRCHVGRDDPTDDLPMTGLLPSRGRLLDRVQKATAFAGDLVRGLHRAGVAWSGEYDKFGPWQCAVQ